MASASSAGVAVIQRLGGRSGAEAPRPNAPRHSHAAARTARLKQAPLSGSAASNSNRGSLPAVARTMRHVFWDVHPPPGPMSAEYFVKSLTSLHAAGTTWLFTGAYPRGFVHGTSCRIGPAR